MCGSGCIRISDCWRSEAHAFWPWGEDRKLWVLPALPPPPILGQSKFRAEVDRTFMGERTMKLLAVLTLSSAIALASSSVAFAGDPYSCKTVRFSDVGWTDITATTRIANE